MANEEQLSILKQGVEVWNGWRAKNRYADIDLRGANLRGQDLRGVLLNEADLSRANLQNINLQEANLGAANLNLANLITANLSAADLQMADLVASDLTHADLREANLFGAIMSQAVLTGSNFSKAVVGHTIIADSDLSETKGLSDLFHGAPSSISTDVFISSKGKLSYVFLRGCGLSDWEIEVVKLYNPDLSNEEINTIQYRMYDLRATQALQVSPLFISYSHRNGVFVDKLEQHLNANGIRFWRDIHDIKSGRIEKQIDRAIRQNPTVLLVLSENSLSSDWVEHEVRTARQLEKDMGRDVLCPVALDDSWKDSRWPKRIIEQVMEYNILDFSEWRDDVKFEGIFRKLIDGLELFYKG